MRPDSVVLASVGQKTPQLAVHLDPDDSSAPLPLPSLQCRIPPMRQNVQSSNQHPPPRMVTTSSTDDHRGQDPLTVTVEYLGALRHATFELGDLTMICGNNNTGKTYATYALFGFLAEWKDYLQIRIPQSQIRPLLNDGVARIDVAAHATKSTEVVQGGCRRYTRQLPRIFASKAVNFKKSKFNLELQSEKLQQDTINKSFERNIRSKNGELFSLKKEKQDAHLVISLLADSPKMTLPYGRIRDVVSDAINDMIFGSSLPRPFIASAERTGAAIFQKELYFARNRLFEEMGRADRDVDPMKLFFTAYQDYPLPVNVNVDFIQRLGTVAKRDSFLSNDHHWVLDDFADIVGGHYVVGNKDALYFRPFRARRRLLMAESSSAVRSLLDVGFYLHHVAEPGDLLMIDEPELNLHPENQRRLARLFARLVNLGIRVFVTTHSDYIVKELNTLIMLNNDTPNNRRIAEREGYRSEDFLSPDGVRVYIAERSRIRPAKGRRTVECQTLVRAPIDSRTGIEARSFDETINKMNDIQESIVWGDDE